jgi:uncharacterized protein (TIGR03437 family)
MKAISIPNLVLLATVISGVADAQVCRLSVAGLNRNRAVRGPVNAECPFSLHSPPFGNWGVTSTFGQKIDGGQFEGWCKDSRVCDNNGNCATHCRDGRYEWNSCTDDPQFRPPNPTLYNAQNGTQQVTTTGINVHGSRIVDVPVVCPVDANGDGVTEGGGCAAVRTYSSGVNFMTLYELDPGTTDDLIQTMYFPEVVVNTGCSPWKCPPASSAWVTPAAYDSPTTPAKVYAEMSMLINSGTFIDAARVCRLTSLRADTVSAASFIPGALAPESIGSVFGQGLAIETAAASSAPLPTSLGGSSITITDSAGVARPAPLFYASHDQINYQVPAGTALGAATIAVNRSDGISSRAAVQLVSVSPGIFSANANGGGVAAAIAIQVAANQSQKVLPVFQCGTIPGSCVATPLELGTDTDQLILVLFATGIRFRSGAGAVQVRIGGRTAEVLYAGAQGQFIGLDQINVRVPRALRGRGLMDVAVSVDGRMANIVNIRVGG